MRAPTALLVLHSILALAALSFLTGCGRSGATLAPDAGSSRSVTGSSAFSRMPGDASEAPGTSRRGIYRRIWPHEDGRSWTYRLTARDWYMGEGAIFPSPDDVPTMTLDDAQALLRNHPIGANPETSAGRYTLRFHGTITTMSGVTKQYLEESVASEGALASPFTVRPNAGFLRLLAKARPDLARRIGARLASAAPTSSSAADQVYAPTLLHGYAWEQNDDWIGNFGDLNQDVSWIYLTSDLAPGSEYSLRLLPDLADDVFLHARVLGHRAATTEAGTFHNALEVLYLVDFGLSEATNEQGDVFGSFRSYLYGSISYVPGLGPVRSYECFIPFIDRPIGPGFSDATASLVEFAPGDSRSIAAR